MLTTKRFALRRLHVACAVGMLGLAPVTASALELGEAAIRSGIGQPLLVAIPYRLSPDEQLTPACVSLAPGTQRDDALPTYSRVSRIVITPTHIEIFGGTRVLEPLIGLTVDVHCLTAPRFVRSYQLFVDLPARAPAILSVDAALASRAGAAIDFATATSEREPASPLPGAMPLVGARSELPPSVEARTKQAPVSARARGQSGESLTQGQTYRVVSGDTLSGIAARVGDRPATIREAAEAIFAANPEAFARGNRDLIKAGGSITIPVMTAESVALPASPSSPAPAAVVNMEPATATASAPTDGARAPTTEPSLPVLSDAAASVAAPEVAEPPPPAAAIVQPSATPAPLSAETTPPSATAATNGRASRWLTALLALGAVIALSAPVLLLRRREREAPAQDDVKPRSAPPRRLVDPTAGFDVVETRLPRVHSGVRKPLPNRAEVTPVDPLASPIAPLDAVTLGIGPVDSVDLDVGTPIVVDERVDWFGDRADASPTAAVAVAATPIEAATARMPVLDDAAPVGQPPLEPRPDAAETTSGDEQHTLTIVELEMLRQDYEAEHTLTQANSKALNDAVADLKATQSARAANADTATLEMPQHDESEPAESRETQRLRSSR